MSVGQIIRRLTPFVKPDSRWVIISLALTLLGAFAAQVNPVVLRYTALVISSWFPFLALAGRDHDAFIASGRRVDLLSRTLMQGEGL